MKKILLSALVAAALPISAQAETRYPSGMELLSGFFDLEVVLTNCKKVAQADRDAFFDRKAALFASLEKRSVNLGVSNGRAKTQKWLAKHYQASVEGTPKRKCKRKDRNQVRENLKLIKGADFSDALAAIGSSKVNSETAFELSNSRNQKTLIFPNSQNVYLSTVANNFEGNTCRKPVVTKTKLVKTTKAKVANLPPFVSAPIKFEEHWTVSCNGMIKRFKIVTDRDSETMKGRYHITAF